MSESVIVSYGKVTIAYDERADKWRFELRGRERSADSLAKAKEFIDKEPKEKNTFVRTAAYYHEWSGDRYDLVEVTAIAEPSSYSNRTEYWVSHGGNRSKKNADVLFAKTAANETLIAEIQQLDAQVDILEQQRNGVVNKLVKFAAEVQ